MSDVKLSLEYYHQDPVEINVFSEALQGLASSYERFLINNLSEGQKVDAKSRLYISQIRSGSILIDLIDLFPIALAFAENSNTIVEFTRHFSSMINALTGKSDPSILETVDKNDLKDLIRFMEPVAKDRSAQYNIGAFTVQGDLILNLGVNTQEGNVIQNNARRQLEQLKNPEISVYNSVLFYWFQARADAGPKQTGFSGIIESISSKPLKVLFDRPELRDRMLGMEDNPFKKAFVVDVVVDTVMGNPFAYRILEIHEIHDM